MIRSNIVVIDDSSTVLRALAEMLGEAGHEVSTFTSGKQALTMLHRRAVDLIITDIYMPNEDGLEVILESRRICPHTPVIAMSGVIGKQNMLDVARRFGACCTLLKPFSKTELLQAIASVVEAPGAGVPRMLPRTDSEAKSNNR